MIYYETKDRIQIGERTFEVRIYDDDDSQRPWERSDGHGPVREIRSRDEKRPGERIMTSGERHAYVWAYDWQGAMQLAKRDGWGLGDKARAELARKLGRQPTPGEVRAESVRRDFEFLNGWVCDEWRYVGVVVMPIDPETDEPDDSDEFTYALWGVKSCGDYWREVARELADEACSELDKEQRERDEWAARDVMTVEG